MLSSRSLDSKCLRYEVQSIYALTVPDVLIVPWQHGCCCRHAALEDFTFMSDDDIGVVTDCMTAVESSRFKAAIATIVEEQ